MVSSEQQRKENGFLCHTLRQSAAAESESSDVWIQPLKQKQVSELLQATYNQLFADSSLFYSENMLMQVDNLMQFD